MSLAKAKTFQKTKVFAMNCIGNGDPKQDTQHMETKRVKQEEELNITDVRAVTNLEERKLKKSQARHKQ